MSVKTKVLNDAADSSEAALSVRGGASDAAAAKGGIDVGLLAYFGLWYLGNYYVSKFRSTCCCEQLVWDDGFLLGPVSRLYSTPHTPVHSHPTFVNQ